MEQKKICVLGLGYIGLPTAAMFATHGHRIVGVDIREDVVNALNKGRIVINEPYLDILVQAAVTSGNLVGACIPEEADVFIIAVPTPITYNKKADMSCVIAAARSIVPFLREGNIVILESTSPVGTVRNMLVPILAESGLSIGEQLFVAHCPERVLPGRILIELVDNKRIVGGINKESALKVKKLYETFVRDEIFVTDVATAEMCKIMENTYRDVNIALANELALLSEKAGINAWEVIALCNKHPRVNILQPGPGVGGHCLAVDPWFLVEGFPDTARLIRLSREVNDSMPEYVMSRIKQILKDIEGKKVVTILGVSYKPDVDDTRESPVLKLAEILEASHEYDVRIVDYHAGHLQRACSDLDAAALGSDLIFLGVNHSSFKNIDYSRLAAVMRHKNILDSRNFIDKATLRGLGFSHYLLGSSC